MRHTLTYVDALHLHTVVISFGATQNLPVGYALPKAMVKSNHEDGLLFAALSHKTLELLHAVPQQVFNRMDLCQFLGTEDHKDNYFGMFCLIHSFNIRKFKESWVGVL